MASRGNNRQESMGSRVGDDITRVTRCIAVAFLGPSKQLRVRGCFFLFVVSQLNKAELENGNCGGRLEVFGRRHQQRTLQRHSGRVSRQLLRQWQTFGNTVKSWEGPGAASSAEENWVINQVSILDPDRVNLTYARYQTVYGTKSVPPSDAEPTTEHLSGLAHVLGSIAAPCGSHNHRIQKKLKLTALQNSIGRPRASGT